MAKLANVSSRTIDYYTELGIIKEAMRSPSNYRLYAKESLAKLEMVKVLKEQKYSLVEISAILNHQGSIEVMDHASKINEHLSGLQEEVAKLYPLIQSENEQTAFLINELILKGQNVLKALLVLMGEMPL